MNRKKNSSGFKFELYKEEDKSPFDKLFDIFKELITHTSGDFDEAVKWQKKAILLCPEDQKASFQSRLDLYKSGKPYREEVQEDH